MKKPFKVLTAIGFSAMLLGSTALPSTSLAVTNKSLANQPAASKDLQKDNRETQKQKFSEDTFTIKYKKPLSAAEHKAAGGTLVRNIKQMDYAVIRVKNKKNLKKVMATYQKIGKVESVQPSGLFTPLSLEDPKASQQYHLSMLQIEKAQKLAGKNKVTVAVIDTGIISSHPDLKGTLLPGTNVANPASQMAPSSHGTHVAGIIGAKKGNGEGGYGVSNNVNILPIDVFDDYYCTDYVLAEGIMTAVQKKAKVINMSLGSYVSSPLVEEAVKYAISKGVVVVAAAGNDGDDTINYPAVYEGVISVGSTNSSKKLSSYSTYGPSVDVVAPGEDVYSTYYDGKSSSYTNMSGTSMASPVVAGAAALLLSKHPNLTPAQVEYILEQTADDLGDKGYDTKYANGLVNPVKALSYDVKKLPSYVKQDWSASEVLKKAVLVDASEKVAKDWAITKPYEQHWIKFDVAGGEYIQTKLEGAKNYDSKIMVHFFDESNKLVQSEEVNRTQDGSMEAKLLQAPENGTMAVGIKDVNGNFDNSGKKAASYKLTIEKADKLPEDESTVENMIELSIPEKAAGPYTLAGDESDMDYFRFTSDTDQLIRIQTPGIPGLNTELGLYNITGMFAEEEGLTEEEKQAILEEYVGYGPDQYANNGGNGEAERLTFNAEAGSEYILTVGGNAQDYGNFFFFEDLFSDIVIGKLKEGASESSLFPYTVSLDSTVLPEDEDQLDMTVYDEEIIEEIEDIEEEEPPTAETVMAAYKSAADELDPYFEEQNAFVNRLFERSNSYEAGSTVSGYLQSGEDMDGYVIESNETALYELTLSNKENVIPIVEIYEYVEEMHDDETEVLSINWIGDNVDWSGFNIKGKEKMYTGFEKGKKYLILVQNGWDAPTLSFEPYKLSTKKVINNPTDSYEPSTANNPAKMPNKKVNGNFAMPYDVDPYYYKATDNGIKMVSIEVGKATSAMKKAYPAELLEGYFGVPTVYEDSNNNGKLDMDDQEIAWMVKALLYANSDFTSGSFKAKKGKGYFVVAEAMHFGMIPMSMLPYTLTVSSVNTKDESTKAKPITLKTSGRMQSAKASFNAGINGGDDDWFNFEIKKQAVYKVKLDAGKETNGVIEIYQNGKLIKKSDSYGLNDSEEFVATLKKGKYQAKVTDANGNASMQPYTFKVHMRQ